MLLEGARLMLVGMSTVFGFLALLVGLMSASAAVFRRLPGPQTELGEAVGDRSEVDARRRALALAVAHRARMEGPA
jgi:Na+-transporting methylmalonyl-CoA/oxaloacetate decarboxylase gamma subunit